MRAFVGREKSEASVRLFFEESRPGLRESKWRQDVLILLGGVEATQQIEVPYLGKEQEKKLKWKICKRPRGMQILLHCRLGVNAPGSRLGETPEREYPDEREDGFIQGIKGENFLELFRSDKKGSNINNAGREINMCSILTHSNVRVPVYRQLQCIRQHCQCPRGTIADGLTPDQRATIHG